MKNNNPKFDYVKRIDGTSYFKDFLSTLPMRDQAKLLAVISNTQEHGLLIAQRMEWIKKLDDNLYELRSKVGSNSQRALYFQVIENRYLITHGFTKKTPPTEIAKAKTIREQYKKGELR